MNPGMRVAGAAGMVAGVLLVFETACFLMSGWSPQKFADPAQAIALLQQGGDALRAAAVFGFAGLVTTTFLVAGLAAALHERSPGLATGSLYLGLIGITGHSLVPLGLWIGTPAFLALAAQNMPLAQSAWAAYTIVSDSAHGISSLFLGASMLMAGLAIAIGGKLSPVIGWIGMGAGALTLTTLLTTGTPLAALGGMLFMPSLALSVVFRFGTGVVLWRRAGSRTP